MTHPGRRRAARHRPEPVAGGWPSPWATRRQQPAAAEIVTPVRSGTARGAPHGAGHRHRTTAVKARPCGTGGRTPDRRRPTRRTRAATPHTGGPVVIRRGEARGGPARGPRGAQRGRHRTRLRRERVLPATAPSGADSSTKRAGGRAVIGAPGVSGGASRAGSAGCPARLAGRGPLPLCVPLAGPVGGRRPEGTEGVPRTRVREGGGGAGGGVPVQSMSRIRSISVLWVAITSSAISSTWTSLPAPSTSVAIETAPAW
ncbi:hypothetical protein SDIAM26S_01044 [Streptomyces diastaticus subsp. diastaticus]